MLKDASKSDIKQLARIHFNELKSDFLPSLGVKFLETLYAELIKYKDNIILVYEDKGKVKGFVVGSSDFGRIFKQILNKNFFRFALILVPNILKNPLLIKKILETMFYVKKQGKGLPNAELVVIAVTITSHRKGLGSKLISGLEKKFTKKGIKKYIVSVNKNNSGANYFYNSLGFKKNKEFLLYGKKINLYLKQII